MKAERSNSLLRPTGIFSVALALSIGWGIRGNYGHEIGAMLPGALAGIVACLFSGREDWRRRVVYFGFFGMLGWAFGGSISYMQIIGYTQSGHSATQLFGFYGLFVVGFLWAGLGSAATALPAVLSSERLDKLFRPLVVLLLTWCILFFFKDVWIDWIQAHFELDGIESPSRRQELALYWLDSDWFEVGCILISLLAYQTWLLRKDPIYRLPVFAVMGATFAFVVAFGIDKTLGFDWMHGFVQLQGLSEDHFPAEQLAVSNWPPAVLHLATSQRWFFRGDSLALLLGAILGVGWFFQQYGQFDEGASLYLHMAIGWFVGFLLLPVFGSLFFDDIGGLRMTPPRGDNWAGVLGAYLGASLFFWRANLKSILFVSIVCGTIGGLGFTGAAWLEGGLVSMGNPNASNDPAIQKVWSEWQATVWAPSPQTPTQNMSPPEFSPPLQVDETWRHWQQQNWHSCLEQTYGFFNGVGLALALGLLARRSPNVDDEPVSLSWRKILAAVFVLPLLMYANLTKNVSTWIEAGLPKSMSAPWFGFELSTQTWFNIFWFTATLGFVSLLLHHRIRRLACVPANALGRGQLMLVLLLWGFVVGNFVRALPGFTAQRLLTEGTISLNAILVTLLVLGFTYAAPKNEKNNPPEPNRRERYPYLLFAIIFAVVACGSFPYAAHRSMKLIYGDAHVGKRGMDFRFGPNANWKRAPLLKNTTHR